MVLRGFRFISPDTRAFLVWSPFKQLSQVRRHTERTRVVRLGGALGAALLTVAVVGGATAQTVDVRQWEGTNALTRQPEQVLAGTMAEWRGLWSRVGLTAPDQFEAGRTSAVGIFLGQRAGPGYSVNILSASRRRDRIMVVFEERAPADVMLAQRIPPTAARQVAGGPGFGPGAMGFAPSNLNAPSVSTLAPPPPPRPTGPPTSPWAIVLINRVDLPITVEQRLFR